MIPTAGRTFGACWIILSGALSACGDHGFNEYRLSGPTMGTRFSVAVATAGDFDRERLQAGIQATLDDVDRLMSTYRPDAELAMFNRATTTDWFPVSARLCHAVDHALRLSELSGGAFDITVGSLVDLWGFGPAGSRTEPPDGESIEDARAASGFRKLHADCARPALRKDIAGIHADLSGYAKGFAVDEIAALLDASGIENYLAEIGGELRARGHNVNGDKWRIAIEKPDFRGGDAETIIRIGDLAVATSGDYRNFFEYEGRRYSHAIDPRTGRPVAHELASVTVLAESAAYADGMATALLILGPVAGPEFAETHGVAAHFLLRRNGEIRGLSSSQFALLTDD